MQPTGEWLNQPGGLAERLRRIRKAAGLTGTALAAAAGWPRSKIPKIENGRQLPSEADIQAWAAACGQPRAVPELLRLAAEAQAVYRQWRLGGGGHELLQGQYGLLVQGASVIRNFEIMAVPGLLQTPGYARVRAEEAVRLHGADPDRAEHAVAARMDRQRALFSPGKTFQFIFCQAALDYLTCPPEVMAGQAAALITFSRLPNVSLGVIPPGVAMPAVPVTGYLIAGDITIVETFTSMITVAASETPAYAAFTDLLATAAACGEDARDLIAARRYG